MSLEFTNAGEFHQGKGNKKSRLGPRTIFRTGATKQSPNAIAITKLKSILMKRGVLNEDVYQYIEILRNSDQIRFMNMNVLAEVLIYIDSGQDISDLNYESISDNIDALIPKDEKQEDLEVVRLRMAATFFRYLRYVLFAESKQQTT